MKSKPSPLWRLPPLTRLTDELGIVVEDEVGTQDIHRRNGEHGRAADRSFYHEFIQPGRKAKRALLGAIEKNGPS
jgi:hypothetical protein